MQRLLRVAGRVTALVLFGCVLSLFDGVFLGAQSHLEPGARAVVFGVGRAGLAVREGPGGWFPMIAVIPEGRELQVLEGPAWSGSGPWYLVGSYDARGGQGWSSGDYLRPQEEAPPPADAAPQDRTATSRGESRDGSGFIASVTGYAIQGRTSTGTLTRWGIVAVDPRVIPLGSKIQIDGFEEEFIAADTGGAVRGNVIDIWFPSYAEARQFGVQSRRVTILEP